jgi:hypothetical protein
MFLTTVDAFKDYMRFLIQTFQASTILGILWLDVWVLEQPIQPEPLYYGAAEIESEVRTPANTQSNLYSSLVFPPNYLCEFLDKASEVYYFSLYL